MLRSIEEHPLASRTRTLRNEKQTEYPIEILASSHRRRSLGLISECSRPLTAHKHARVILGAGADTNASAVRACSLTRSARRTLSVRVAGFSLHTRAEKSLYSRVAPQLKTGNRALVAQARHRDRDWGDPSAPHDVTTLSGNNKTK